MMGHFSYYFSSYYLFIIWIASTPTASWALLAELVFAITVTVALRTVSRHAYVTVPDVRARMFHGNRFTSANVQSDLDVGTL